MRFAIGDSVVPEREVAVLFASYEPRSTRLASDLVKSRFRGRVVVFFCADSNRPQTATHVAKLKKMFRRKIEVIPVSRKDPAPIIEAAARIRDASSMLVDVTCFTRENLFALLWAARLGIDNTPELTFAYTAPRSYGSWLSRGYADPHNIIGFGGAFATHKRRVLICLVGYEIQRAIEIIEKAEPSRVVMAVGTDPAEKDFYVRNRAALQQAIGSARFAIEQLPMGDPEPCRLALERLVRESTDAAVHVAPFNSKLSCLAVYSAWLQDRNIRVWNATPKYYNVRGYSRGAKLPRFFNVTWR